MEEEVVDCCKTEEEGEEDALDYVVGYEGIGDPCATTQETGRNISLSVFPHLEVVNLMPTDDDRDKVSSPWRCVAPDRFELFLI